MTVLPFVDPATTGFPAMIGQTGGAGSTPCAHGERIRGDQLVAQANAAGGRDNITVVIARFDDADGE